jgi:small-conductance mechanosensitive channel
VKLLGSGIEIEGVVSSLGLLYTTFDAGENTTMVPNSSILNVAVTPLREPEGVDLRARLPADVTPGQLEELLRESIETPLRGRPDVELEELDGDELVLRIAATPRNPQDGAHLASEVLEVVSREAARQAAVSGDARGGD